MSAADWPLPAAVGALLFGAGYAVAPEPVAAEVPACVCPAVELGPVLDAVSALELGQAAVVEHLAVVAGDCVVPGLWLDVGILPVRQVLDRAALTGAPVGD